MDSETGDEHEADDLHEIREYLQLANEVRAHQQVEEDMLDALITQSERRVSANAGDAGHFRS